IIVILTIVLKELMARLSFYIGKIIKSETLMADAWHHRSDAISSVLVVISFISVYFGLFAIDGIASFIIALFITYIGINILKKSVNILIGTAPSANVIKNIKDIALHNNDNVISVHDVIINTYGKLSIGSLHIVIPDTLNLVTAHAISDSIEKMIKSEMNMDITVHIDPIDNKDNLLRNLHTYLNSIISGDKNYIEFHDLHILRKDQKNSIYFELVFRRSDMNNKEYLIGLLEEKIKHTFNEIDEIYIEVDPEYTY
ncbi:cation diffusion facilitator family transporter, partial [candidate division WOR-3 bacterium]|nr:cation diffusion facilitator family transporter [candidate division WOR-3 bacterium]